MADAFGRMVEAFHRGRLAEVRHRAGDRQTVHPRTLTADFRRILKDLARVTNSGGRLIADLNDPTHPDARVDGDLEERTVEPGLPYRRFRVEHDDCMGSWIDLLMTGERVLEAFETPWPVESTLRSESDAYAVVLVRDA